MSRKAAYGTGLVIIGLLLLMRGGGGGKRAPRNVVWSDADVRAFRSAVEASGVPMDYVLQVYASESGLDPAASSGSAWGLPQFIETTLRGVGYRGSPSSFATLTVAEQSPYIGRLLKSQVAYLGRIPRDAVDLYALNFWPAAAKRGDDAVVVRDSRDARERAAYVANAPLDRKRKGWISRDDLQSSLNRVSKLPALVRAREQIRRLAA